MRKLEDVVQSLTESIVSEYLNHGDTGDISNVPAYIRAACTEALRRALPLELELQRQEAAQEATQASAHWMLGRKRG